MPIPTRRYLRLVLNGFYNYYAVPTNFRALNSFYSHIMRYCSTASPFAISMGYGPHKIAVDVAWKILGLPIAAFLAGAGRSTAWPDPGAHCVCPRIPRIGTEGGAFAVSAANACLQRGGVRPNARTSRTGEASTRGRGACRDRRRERGRPSPAGVSDARRACRPRPGSRARHAPPRGGQARYSCPGLASASRS